MPPKGRDSALELYISQVRSDVEQDLTKRRKFKAKDNLTAAERQALEGLLTREDIIIKPAEKGSAVAVMAKEDCLTEALRQLARIM